MSSARRPGRCFVEPNLVVQYPIRAGVGGDATLERGLPDARVGWSYGKYPDGVVDNLRIGRKVVLVHTGTGGCASATRVFGIGQVDWVVPGNYAVVRRRVVDIEIGQKAGPRIVPLEGGSSGKRVIFLSWLGPSSIQVAGHGIIRQPLTRTPGTLGKAKE